MGITRPKNGDDSIIYHVGKDLPAEGESILLVPGMQNAQGRGVYCSKEVQLKYAGGEHYRVQTNVIPVFCIPMHGVWTQAVLKKKNNQIVYHSNKRVIALNNLHQVEMQVEGGALRYYWPTEVSFYAEPTGKIFDEFSKAVREGKTTFEQAQELLKEEFHIPPDTVESHRLAESLSKAIQAKEIPTNAEILKFIESKLYIKSERRVA